MASTKGYRFFFDVGREQSGRCVSADPANRRICGLLNEPGLRRPWLAIFPKPFEVFSFFVIVSLPLFILVVAVVRRIAIAQKLLLKLQNPN